SSGASCRMQHCRDFRYSSSHHYPLFRSTSTLMDVRSPWLLHSWCRARRASCNRNQRDKEEACRAHSR
ncbi:hypothetical protein PMAYCL1PPCAC_20897, partial [Pristionchus mayeri]